MVYTVPYTLLINITKFLLRVETGGVVPHNAVADRITRGTRAGAHT